MTPAILYNLIVKFYTPKNTLISSPCSGRPFVHKIGTDCIAYKRINSGPFIIDYQNMCNIYNMYHGKGVGISAAQFRAHGIKNGTEIPAMGIFVDIGLTTCGFTNTRPTTIILK